MVVADGPFQLQIAEEDPQRDDVPGQRGGAQLLGVEPRGIVGQVADRQRHDVPSGQPDEEPLQIAVVRGHGVGRQMALAGAIGQEAAEPSPAVCAVDGGFGGTGRGRRMRHGAAVTMDRAAVPTCSGQTCPAPVQPRISTRLHSRRSFTPSRTAGTTPATDRVAPPHAWRTTKNG